MSSNVQSASSKEFRRGVGRARALRRQAFGHWPGVPVVRDGGSLVWLSYADQANQRQIAIDGLRLRDMEQTLTCLVSHHRDHLNCVVPNGSDWFERTSNCLELLKEFLHKPPSAQPNWPAVIDKMRIATRWKQRIFDLSQRWPKLQPLLWHLCFLELTGTDAGRLACLPWLEAHAEQLASLMHRADGVSVALMLLQVGPHIDSRWLNTIFKFLADDRLGQTPFVATFAHADDLAKTLRERLNNKFSPIPERPDSTTLGEKLTWQLTRFLRMKPSAVSKVTGLLGSVVSDDLSDLVQALNSRADQAERRLLKELHKIGQLGVQYYVESVGLHRALAGAHVVTNLREESQSLLQLFELASGLCDETGTLDKLSIAQQFFERVSPLKIACRIRMAWQWHEAGWKGVGRFLPALNELIARRGLHIEMVKHWWRRLVPSVTTENNHAELIVTGVNHASLPAWQRAMRTLEYLVYDAGERLTEASVTAIVKLSVSIDSIETVINLCRKIDAHALASASLIELEVAVWLASDAGEVRMVLAWFKLHPQVVYQIYWLRLAFNRPEHIYLLRRLIGKRDHATIGRWNECIELLESLGVSVPERLTLDSSGAAQNWIESYPAELHDVLRRLANTCVKAETVAQELLSDDCPSRTRVLDELANLKRLLADREWSQQQSVERLRRMQKRIENLQQRSGKPYVLTPERAAHLIEKLNDRVDLEMYACVASFARRALEASLGELNIVGLRERLQQPPYDRILPALRNLKSEQQQLAWQALRSSWDNSLKLLSEPANQRFLAQMVNKGLKLDAWVGPALALEGQRADGTPYRVAFTQDPLDILLMGHHFDTCLSLSGGNFFSTVANLVDANKRVLYGRTDSGQVVGRCLFALTNQGQVQTFHRYQNCKDDGFDRLVDEFALQLVGLMGTSLSESGQVSCLVARSWYNDGCVAVPTSARGKSGRLEALIQAQPEVDPYELALQVFDSDEELIQATKCIDDAGLFYDSRVVRSLFPLLVNASLVPLSLRLRMAAIVWEQGDQASARNVFMGLTNRDVYRSLGSKTLNDLIDEKSFVDMIVDRDRHLARRLLHRSRPCYIHSDEQEVHHMRRYMRDQILARSANGP